MADITIDGRGVFFTTGGKEWEDGLPLLVFLHGAGLTQSVWVAQSRALAHHGWNVAAVDLPGHGKSGDLPSLATIEDYSSWTARFLAGLESFTNGAAPAVLAGHSMGAAIALTLAAQQPEQAAGLVLMGAAAEMTVNPELLAATRDNPKAAVDFIASHAHHRDFKNGGAAEPGTWQTGTSLALLKSCPGEVLHRDFSASNQWAGNQYTGKVSCPALIISGQGDRMIQTRQGKILADAIPGGRFEIVPETGHMMMAEAPAEVTELMRGFLADFPV